MTVAAPGTASARRSRGRGRGAVRLRGLGLRGLGLRGLVAVACLVAGLGCTVAAWVLAIPPFGAYDEFDHAFRASAVAHGQLVAPPSRATRGTGAFVRASPDVVEAASAECLAMPYTTASDCASGEQGVPSGAGRYSPAYYALFGWAGEAVPGWPGLVVQRGLSAAACLALLAAAGALVTRWPNPELGLRALVVAGSPILMFSLALFAPNGLEMAAGAAWWAGLLTVALAMTRGAMKGTGAALAVCGVSGVLLATLRALGPLWMLASAAVVLLLVPRERIGRLLRARPVRVTGGVLAVAVLAGTAWTLSQGALVIGKDPTQPGAADPLAGWRFAAGTAPLKLIQLVTQLPGRGSPPPPAALAGWLLAFGLLVVPALARASRRGRIAWAVLLAAVVALPVAIEAATYGSFGAAWQGRYVLPLAVGVPLLAAAVAGPAGGGRSRVLIDSAATTFVTAVAQGVVLWTTVQFYGRYSPSYQAGFWPLVPQPVLPGLVVAGSVLVAAGLALVVPGRGRGPAEVNARPTRSAVPPASGT